MTQFDSRPIDDPAEGSAVRPANPDRPYEDPPPAEEPTQPTGDTIYPPPGNSGYEGGTTTEEKSDPKDGDLIYPPPGVADAEGGVAGDEEPSVDGDTGYVNSTASNNGF